MENVTNNTNPKKNSTHSSSPIIRCLRSRLLGVKMRQIRLHRQWKDDAAYRAKRSAIICVESKKLNKLFL